MQLLKGGKRPPPPRFQAYQEKRPVLLRANFILTKDRKRPYYGHFCCIKYTGKGLVVKRPGVLSKVQNVLLLVLGVGVFSLLPKLFFAHSWKLPAYTISMEPMSRLERET